jgi:lambda repressor-like predicted transcriptional regulator
LYHEALASVGFIAASNLSIKSRCQHGRKGFTVSPFKSARAHDIIASPNRREHRTMAKKKSRKTGTKRARKTMAKPAPKKHLSHADRVKILAEAKSKGWTADQIARKAGVSKWTVYGWNKRGAAKGKRTTVKRGRPGRPTRQARGSLGDMLRPLIAVMVRAELARLVGR